MYRLGSKHIHPSHGGTWYFPPCSSPTEESAGMSKSLPATLSPTLTVWKTPPRMMCLHTLEPRISPPTCGTCCTHMTIPIANICFKISEANLFGLHKWTQMQTGKRSNLVSLVSRGFAGMCRGIQVPPCWLLEQSNYTGHSGKYHSLLIACLLPQ